MVGGRTNHRGRISLRFGPDDFRGKTLDGPGDDWPIAYEDVAPYYDRVDDLVGIFGSQDGFHNEPDGRFLPPPEPRCYEKLMPRGAASIGIPVLVSRMSILTGAKPEAGRAACHYGGQCNRGCSVGATFSVGHVLLKPALATGNLTLITHAMAREVLTDDEGRASGVSYVDTRTLSEQQVQAKAVVLAASACESARLLLNSASAPPQRLGRGRQVPDGHRRGLDGRVRAVARGRAVPHLRRRGRHAHLHPVVAARAARVARLSARLPLRDVGRARDARLRLHAGHRGSQWAARPGRARSRRRRLRRTAQGRLPAPLRRLRRLQRLRRDDRPRRQRVRRRPRARRPLRHPTLTFDVTWGDEELKQARHMQMASRELLKSIGGEISDPPGADRDYGISTPGEIVHEAGCVRMPTPRRRP